MLSDEFGSWFVGLGFHVKVSQLDTDKELINLGYFEAELI